MELRETGGQGKRSGVGKEGVGEEEERGGGEVEEAGAVKGGEKRGGEKRGGRRGKRKQTMNTQRGSIECMFRFRPPRRTLRRLEKNGREAGIKRRRFMVASFCTCKQN